MSDATDDRRARGWVDWEARNDVDNYDQGHAAYLAGCTDEAVNARQEVLVELIHAECESCRKGLPLEPTTAGRFCHWDSDNGGGYCFCQASTTALEMLRALTTPTEKTDG